MKLFLISQRENQNYNTYSDAVVAAPNEAIARQMHPADGSQVVWGEEFSNWCDKPESVNVEYLGEAKEGIPQKVVCHSYHAG